MRWDAGQSSRCRYNHQESTALQPSPNTIFTYLIRRRRAAAPAYHCTPHAQTKHSYLWRTSGPFPKVASAGWVDAIIEKVAASFKNLLAYS